MECTSKKRNRSQHLRCKYIVYSYEPDVVLEMTFHLYYTPNKYAKISISNKQPKSMVTKYETKKFSLDNVPERNSIVKAVICKANEALIHQGLVIIRICNSDVSYSSMKYNGRD